jgi:pyruvate/2-oxoglutarate/acetoin dehydrogenase E1 component
VVLPLDQCPVVTSDTIQPIGGAELRKPDTDAVIITWGTMARVALEAAQLLESEGLQMGVLDLRWLAPLDEEANSQRRDTRKRQSRGRSRSKCDPEDLARK